MYVGRPLGAPTANGQLKAEAVRDVTPSLPRQTCTVRSKFASITQDYRPHLSDLEKEGRAGIRR